MPGPRRSLAARATSRSTSRSWTASWTISRLVAVQRWPEVPKAPQSAPSTARSRLASSMTISAFLPPHSSDTRLPVRPHSAATCLPVSVEPVIEIRRIVGIAAHRLADDRAAALHQVDHAAGHAGVGQCADELGPAHRRVGGRLQHHRVAADQGVQRFPGRDGHGEVPRRDQPANADRLADGEAELVGQLRGGRVAVEPSAFAGGQFGHVDGLLHVAAAFGDRLAGLAGDPARRSAVSAGPGFRRRGGGWPRGPAAECAARRCMPVPPLPRRDPVRRPASRALGRPPRAYRPGFATRSPRPLPANTIVRQRSSSPLRGLPFTHCRLRCTDHVRHSRGEECRQNHRV